MKSRYSRRAKVETRRNYKKIILYILITVGVLVVLFFFGLNLFIKYAGFFMELDSSDTPIEIQDTTPPPPPNLRSLPRVTNEREVEIRGNTEAGAKVKLMLNNRQEEVVANNEGQFTYIFELNDGKNQFWAVAIDSAGNESAETESITINFDDEPPELEIITPDVGQEFVGSENRQVSIEGQTEEDAQVSINGKWAVVDNNGKFSYVLSLEDGENNFEVVSKDESGNETKQELTVIFTP